MGDRCINTENEEGMNSRKIAVFDLDGTLYRGATFRKYLLWGASTLFKRGMYLKSFMVVWRFALSKAGIESHKTMKYFNCRMFEGILSEEDNKAFTDTLMSGLNRNVIDLLNRFKRDGYLTVLSTASPESYCLILAERLGFDVCHATPNAPEYESEYVENRGVGKLEKIRTLEDQTGGKLAMVVTDHYDDLPLLKANSQGTNYLVNTSEASMEIITSSASGVRIIMHNS
jgi:hypothetical protein